MSRRRIASFAFGLAFVVAAGVSVLHLPIARGWLRRIGGCPVGNASPAAIEAARMEAVRATRGTHASPSRPALGFSLDVTTVDDVRAWAEQHHITCAEKRASTFVQCLDVPASALGVTFTQGTVSDVSFGFRPHTLRLVNVTATRDTTDAVLAERGMRAIAHALGEKLGAPTTREGEATASYLASGAYHTATFGYAYRDYMASVTATRRPDARIVLHEHYLSAVD